MHLFHDTPDYYNTSKLPRFWDDSHADAIVSAGNGYDGYDSLSGSTEDAYVLKFHEMSGQSLFAVGGKFRCDVLPGADKVIWAVTDSAGTIQCSAVLQTDGKISIWKGDMTTMLVESNDAITTAVDLDFGFQGLVAGAGGWAEVYIGTSGDPTSWAAFVRVSNADTAGGADETWRGTYIGLTDEIHVSHVYSRDGQGDVTALVPGYYILVRFPTAQGIYTGLAPNTGTSVPAVIDDPTPDDDTTYGYTFLVEGSYTVVMDIVPTTTTVVYAAELVANVKSFPEGVGIAYRARLVLDPDGDRILVNQSWHSTSDAEWRAFRNSFPSYPPTGLPWTAALLNNAEWGGFPTI